MSTTFTFKAINSENWSDFAELMRSDAQCSDCWCLNHREPAGCATGSAAEQKMKALTLAGEVRGLLAYEGRICVGWIAVDPMDKMVGHDCKSSGVSGEWTIHCMFVKDGFRGKGLSTLMIKEAIVFARANGASLVSAFPIPEDQRKKFPEGVAEFSGRFKTYNGLGFSPVGEPSEFYQRVELR